MKKTQTCCDQCGAMVSATGRRFKLLAVLTLVNGHERQASSERPDLCSERCVVASLTTLIREAEALPMVLQIGVVRAER